MRKPANKCEECANFRVGAERDVCKMGKKPRFYVPKSSLDMDFGWKISKCDSFQEATANEAKRNG